MFDDGPLGEAGSSPDVDPAMVLADVENRQMLTDQNLQIERWRAEFDAATGARASLAAFGPVWPLAYMAGVTPARAIRDATTLLTLEEGGLRVSARLAGEDQLRLTVAVAGGPRWLAEMLPGLQSLGLEVLAEQPYAVPRPDGTPCWLYDFTVALPPVSGSVAESLPRLEEALTTIWAGGTETDAFNRLVLVAGLNWRQMEVLRAYGHYLHQLALPWSREYPAFALAAHPGVAADLVRLFQERFHPAAEGPDLVAQDRLAKAIEEALNGVANLTDDRVLRSYLAVIQATLRTNFYRATVDGTPSAIALKLAPDRLYFGPMPRPRFEVFVDSPRIEAVHLRFGPVARGGLRWSDRYEDLRTEILGLAAAQVAKNSVIVPTGAKGGFVVKRPPGLRGALTVDEGRAAYREFIQALLDVHDNLEPTNRQPIRDPSVVAYDDVDAYLVVAADKGTAGFSDLANAVAAARGYWLGDAFASGGSAGYDHKALGITARGAWCSVRRHFTELGIDPDRDRFTVVGVGDMSGDVFGNGMLLSPHLHLVAAFDHRHIFLDPTPDPERSFEERARMFALPGSTWADYSTSLISRGGGVYPRAAKAVPMTPEVMSVLGLDDAPDTLTPPELIRAILAAPVDLLWNGGIGTYVKALDETHAEVGDKSNDGIRIDADELRARAVVEGGNLGLTQRARIAYATRGGKINTDAIDNSAGVGSSDREVNIKIALTARADLDRKARDALLASMAAEVCQLVLAENVAQNELLGFSSQFAGQDVGQHERVMARLEDTRGLDRMLLGLPGSELVEYRRQRGRGLTSPELAVLTAQVKHDLKAALIADDLPDDVAVRDRLVRYFPTAVGGHPSLFAHPLSREIIATELANTVVDLAGLSFTQRMLDNANAAPTDAVRAFLVICEVFDLPSLWQQIRASSLPPESARALLRESLRILDSGSRWVLRTRPQPIAIVDEVQWLRPDVAGLVDVLQDLLQDTDRADLDRRMGLVDTETEPGLARTVFELLDQYCLLDISEIARQLHQPPRDVAEVYFRLKDRRRINALLSDVVDLPSSERWTALARVGLHDDLYEAARVMTMAVLARSTPRTPSEEALALWERSVGRRLANLDDIVTDSRRHKDLIHLSVATRHVRMLAQMSTAPEASIP